MRSYGWLESGAAVLAACSLEAAWIALVYVLVGSLAGAGTAPLTIVAFAAATALGLGLARWSARLPGRPYRTPLAVLVVVAAVAGWLLPAGADAVRVVEDPFGVLAVHPGGVLLGLAVLRGTAHVTPDDDERIAEVALGPGLVGIATIWAMLTISGGAREPATVGAAFAATVTFVTAGLLSMGLARLVGLRTEGGVGTDGRAWWGVLVAVVAGMLAVAIPLALILGVPVDSAIRGALGPIGEVLVPVVTMLLLPAALLGSVLTWLITLLRTGGSGATNGPIAMPAPPVLGPGNTLGPTGTEGVILALVPIILAIVVTFLLVRRFLAQPDASRTDTDVIEIREIEGPTGGVRLGLPHLPIPHRPLVPRTASEAYLATLEVLAQWPEAARDRSETPAEHARRLAEHPVGPTLGRLAADYALTEFGDRTLPPSEHRRAVERWRRLRSMRDR